MISLLKDQLVLVNRLLQANQTAQDLKAAQKLGQNWQKGYSVKDRLLKRHRKLVVTESVCIDLIMTAHCSITTAYPGKTKTKRLIKE